MDKKLKERLIKGTAIIFIIVVLSTLFSFFTGTNCLIKSFIGIPCPACGMTRAYLSLLRLDFGLAFYYHPLFWLVPPIFINAFFAMIKPAYTKTAFFNISVIVCIVAILICYLIRMILFFPHTAPMDFGHETILARLLELLGIKLFG